MLSRETLEEYRRMTPGQRMSLALRMTTENLPYVFAGPSEIVARRFELLRRQNDERNQRMCEAMSRAERRRRGRLIAHKMDVGGESCVAPDSSLRSE